ncbi:MAG: MEDS domain-containing protein [Candidatus Omnitrophota bacterium]|jgi:hypothetical protein
MCPESALGNLDHGTHLCSIYRDKNEQLSSVLSYIKGGLFRGDKIISILTEGTRSIFVKTLSDLGLELEKCREWGQFIFIDDKEFYLGQGCFDPDRIIQMVTQEQNNAAMSGYKGVRGIAEMDCFLSRAPGTEKLIEYESNLNYFFPGSRLTSICHYREDLFDEDTLLGVLYTHPKAIIYGKLYDNHYYIPPEQFPARLKDGSIPGTYRLLRDTLIAQGPL